MVNERKGSETESRKRTHQQHTAYVRPPSEFRNGSGGRTRVAVVGGEKNDRRTTVDRAPRAHTPATQRSSDVATPCSPPDPFNSSTDATGPDERHGHRHHQRQRYYTGPPINTTNAITRC